MENSSKWFEFMDLAQALLLEGETIDNQEPNIQIAIEPSFDTSILLQLVLNDNEVRWHRTTWLKLVDAAKFSNPIENLKYIGQKIIPTIKKESGVTSIKKLQTIIGLAKEISLKPDLDKWNGIILDGIHCTLRARIESTQRTFEWNHLPEGWEELKKLATMLEELNKELK